MEKETGRERTLSDDSLRLMADYDWPGNVRELENAIERACALSSGPVLHLGDMPTQLQDLRMQRCAEAEGDPATMALPAEGFRSAQAGEDGIVSIAEMEKQAILGTIRQLKGDKLLAAKLLGIGKTTLYRKLKEYGITDVSEATD
jgi:two-component system response regulator HydG